MPRVQFMGTVSTSCPQCGAPLEFRATAVLCVCEYCQNSVVRTDLDVKSIGRLGSILDNGSPILLHAHGSSQQVPFEIVGRLQVRFDRGTWNEWLLEFADGTEGWLAEFLGHFALLRASPPPPAPLPPYTELTIGTLLDVAGQQLRVTDRREAHYQGAEGWLPYAAQPGCSYFSVDLRGSKHQLLTFDYGDHPQDSPQVVYSGRTATLDELQLRPRRTFEGWTP